MNDNTAHNRAGAGIVQDLMRELDRNSMAIGYLDDRSKEHAKLIEMMQALLYQGGNGDSFVTQMRLQATMNADLQAWKKTLITRFWQIFCALLIALLTAGTTLVLRQEQVTGTLEHKIQGLEQQIQKLPSAKP